MDNENQQGESQSSETTQAVEAPNELTMLKERARLMGIVFSNNIGPDALKAKINAKLAGEADPEAGQSQTNPLAAAGEPEPEAPVVKKTLNQLMYETQMKLVRVRITNMDPRKASLSGEIFTVANEYVGTVRKFIPYGEATEDGYHIPQILYDNLKEREFLNIRTVKDKKTGVPMVTSSMAKEFAIEVLEPLTQEELKQLATAQIAAGSVE